MLQLTQFFILQIFPLQTLCLNIFNLNISELFIHNSILNSLISPRVLFRELRGEPLNKTFINIISFSIIGNIHQRGDQSFMLPVNSHTSIKQHKCREAAHAASQPRGSRQPANPPILIIDQDSSNNRSIRYYQIITGSTHNHLIRFNYFQKDQQSQDLQKNTNAARQPTRHRNQGFEATHEPLNPDHRSG